MYRPSLHEKVMTKTNPQISCQSFFYGCGVAAPPISNGGFLLSTHTTFKKSLLNSIAKPVLYSLLYTEVRIKMIR